MLKTLGQATIVGTVVGTSARVLAADAVAAGATLLTGTILCTSLLALSPILVIGAAVVALSRDARRSAGDDGIRPTSNHRCGSR